MGPQDGEVGRKEDGGCLAEEDNVVRDGTKVQTRGNAYGGRNVDSKGVGQENGSSGKEEGEIHFGNL